MLFVVKSSQYAHSTEDTTQRVVNMLIAAMPTGAPTSKFAAVAAGIAAITAEHACCCCYCYWVALLLAACDLACFWHYPLH